LTSSFTQGFSEKVTLTIQELAALPVLLLRRQLVGCLHWLGRWRVGLSSERLAIERLTWLRVLQEWLAGEGAFLPGNLVRMGVSASSDPGTIPR